MPGPRPRTAGPALLLLVLLALLAHGGRGSPARPAASRTTAKAPMLGRAMPLEALVGADGRDGQGQPMGSFMSTTKSPTTADAGGSTVSSTSSANVESTVGGAVGSTVGNTVVSTEGTSTVGSTAIVSTTIGASGSPEEETTTSAATSATAATSTTALASPNDAEADAAATATPSRRRHHDGHGSSRRRDPADAANAASAASSKSLDMGGVGVRSQYDAPEEAPLRKAMLRVVLLPHRHDDDDQDGGDDAVDSRAIGHPAKHVRSRMMAAPHGPPEPEPDAQRDAQPGQSSTSHAPKRSHAASMVRIVSSQQIRILSDDPASRPGIMLSYDNDPDSSVVFTSRRKHTEVHMPSAVLHGKAAADGVHHNSKLIFTIEHNSEGGENGTARSDGQSILLQDTMVVPASGGVPVSMAFAMPSPMLSGVSPGAVPSLPNPPSPPAQDQQQQPQLQQQQPAEAGVVTAQPAASPASFEVQPAALPDTEASLAGAAAPSAPPPPQAAQPAAPPAAPPAGAPEPLTEVPSFVAPAEPPPPTLNPLPAAVGLDAVVPSSQPPPAPPPGVEDGLAPPPGALPLQPHPFPFPFPPGSSAFGMDAPPAGPVRSRMMHQPGHPDADDGHDPHEPPVLSRAMTRDHDEDSDKSNRWPKLAAHITPAPDAARHPAARGSTTPAATTTRRPASSSSTSSTATSSASTGHSGLAEHSKEEARSTAMARKPAVSQVGPVGPVGPVGHSASAPTTTTTLTASSNSSTRATPPATPRRPGPGRTTRQPLPAAG